MADPLLYNREYFLSHCEGYREFARGSISPRLKKATALIADSRPLKILDVGCGRGELIQYLVKKGHTCEGIDYSKDAVSIAQESAIKNLQTKEKENCRFHIMDVQAMSFTDNAFDVCFMLDVVEHLHPWELKQALVEVRRVLKPGARLIIHTVPNKWVIKPARLIMRLFNMPSEVGLHVNEQSLFSLKRFVYPCFSGKTWIERERGFWWFWAESSNRLPNQFVGKLLRSLDYLLDNKIIAPVLDLRPLIFFTGTDIWGDLRVKKEGRLS